MKKLIILTAVTSILLAGSQQQAWAGKKSHQEDGDYSTFRKIVHILDDLINDDYRKGKRRVRVRTYSFPRRRVCYYRGPFEVCRDKVHKGRHLRYRRGNKNRHWKQAKRGHDGYDY